VIQQEDSTKQETLHNGNLVGMHEGRRMPYSSKLD
jgi:hypothetical protein